MGLAISFSTIVIPALTGNDHLHNPDEQLHITPDEASWIGEHDHSNQCKCVVSEFLYFRQCRIDLSANWRHVLGHSGGSVRSQENHDDRLLATHSGMGTALFLQDAD